MPTTLGGLSTLVGTFLPSFSQRETAIHHPAGSSPTTLTNVLHIINGEHFSGAERVQQLLARSIPQFGFRIDFACLKAGKFAECCGLEKSQVFSFPMANKIDFQVVDRILPYAEEHEYKLIHAHTPRSAMIAAVLSRKLGIPWIYHIHSPTRRDSTRGWANYANDWIEHLSLLSCSHLITVSKSLRREMIQRGWKRTNLTAVHNGTAPMQTIDAAARLKSPNWRLGMVALMRPRKGVEVLLDAMKILKYRKLPIQLDLIGGFETPEYQAQILALIEEWKLGDVVRWRGFTSDVPAMLREIDALVLPSLFGEGLPMVVLEAMSCGIPCIASKVEGTPEAVRHGLDGLLCVPGDAIDTTEKIARLCSDRGNWLQMCVNAVERHRDRFSDTKMARGVARVYEKVLRE